MALSTSTSEENLKAVQDLVEKWLKNRRITIDDSEGIILVDFLEESKTITGIYYTGALRKFKAAVIKKCRESCTGASCSIMTMRLLTQELQGLF